MDRKPLLVFNAPDKDLERAALHGGGGKVHTPGHMIQSKRVFAKLDEVKRQFAEYITLSKDPTGVQPERVLVIETAGDVTDLARALSQVPGLEFISQSIISDDFQDELFYGLDNKGQPTPVIKKAFLSMSNQDGLKKLHTIWKQYLDLGSVPGGMAPLKHAFERLVDIRFWDAKDRIESTYLYEDWSERLTYSDSSQTIQFEIELWFRSNKNQRIQSESKIRKIITECDGCVKSSFSHDGIKYHALLGELPIHRVDEVIQKGSDSLELIRCDEVMFFRPLGQCVTPVSDIPGDDESSLFSQENKKEFFTKPIVALFDGLPLVNHEALADFLDIDDPDDFESCYQKPSEHVHGTSMASLIIHGDLSNQGRPLDGKIYVRPILAPCLEDINGHRRERIPPDYLPVDLIHRAVVRMKKGENGQPPSSPDVVIVNLSVGDPYRPYDGKISPWARMLDWLSIKYNILFVVSAGNMSQSIPLNGIKERDLSILSPEALEREVIKAIAMQKQDRRMMSPAESINSLTVSAAHIDDYSGLPQGNRVDLFVSDGIFSPINPVTLGHKNSVKPEILMPGGRQVYVNSTYSMTQDVVFKVASGTSFGPGQKCALPTLKGSITGYGYTAGTSNAAAMTTRRLAFLYETIKSIKEFDKSSALSFAPDSVILKALLAHGAEFQENIKDNLIDLLKTKENSRIFKTELNQFMGFGLVNEERIHACSKNQATLIYTGVLDSGKAHKYELPLPHCLSAVTDDRRLVITLAWMSPINYSHQDYRAAQLWVTAGNEVLNLNEGDYYHHHLRNGTLYHEVKFGDKASVFTHGDSLPILVHCNGRAGFDDLKVPYALVATLDSPIADLPIYEEVKQGLEVKIKQSQSV